MKPSSLEIKIVTTATEKHAAFDIRKTVFVGEQDVPIALEIDEHDETAVHFIALIKGEVVGASRLRFETDYGKLERICVLAEQRGKQIGQELVLAMEEEIKRNDFPLAKLNAQTPVESFYEQLGYMTISAPFVDAGIPHVKMTKQLTL